MSFVELVRANADRIWSYVDRRGPDECWPWIGALNRAGYGQIDLSRVEDGALRRHNFNAHRVVWTLVSGTDPGPKCVRHKCDWRPCCNPRHLKPGTAAENSQDMIDRFRSTKGEHNPNASLDVDDVRQIRALAAAGQPRAVIASAFDVTPEAVRLIVKRERWSHVA